MDNRLAGFKAFIEQGLKPKNPAWSGTKSLDSQDVQDLEFGVKDPSWRKDVNVVASTNLDGKTYQDFSGYQVVRVDRDMVLLRRIVTGNKVFQRTPSGQLAMVPDANKEDGQGKVIAVPRKAYIAWMNDRGMTADDMASAAGGMGGGMPPMGGM